MNRIKRKDIKSLEYLSGQKIVELGKGQIFYELPKSYEIWQEEYVKLPFRVIRISRDKIGWVNTW